MYTPLSESLGTEKLTITASAATVGRPKGIDGKKMSPRRAKMTNKEVDKINTKGYMKAGGPGSGRKPNWSSSEKEQLNNLHKGMVDRGFKYHHSSGSKEEHGMISHTYYKGTPNSSAGRQSAQIRERANGEHTATNF